MPITDRPARLHLAFLGNSMTLRHAPSALASRMNGGGQGRTGAACALLFDVHGFAEPFCDDSIVAVLSRLAPSQTMAETSLVFQRASQG